MRKRLPIFEIAVVTLTMLAVGLGVAAAQTTDTYTVNYFSYANTSGAPDANVRIDNPGLSAGDLCAMIYVFDSFQEMSECCGCLQTPDGLQTFSVNKNLVSNPLTGVYVSTGMVKVVSAKVNIPPYGCDPTGANGSLGVGSLLNIKPTPNLRTWVTHVDGSGYLTETESSASPLGVPELHALEEDCDFISILGSGQGICSCGWGN